MSAVHRRLGAIASQLSAPPSAAPSPLTAHPTSAKELAITAVAAAVGAAIAFSYDKYGLPRTPGSSVPRPGSPSAIADAEDASAAASAMVGSSPLTGPAGLLEVHGSGWVAPASFGTPSDADGAIDFARSAVTFRIDLAAKPAATMSAFPLPFPLPFG